MSLDQYIDQRRKSHHLNGYVWLFEIYGHVHSILDHLVRDNTCGLDSNERRLNRLRVDQRAEQRWYQSPLTHGKDRERAAIVSRFYLAVLRA